MIKVAIIGAGYIGGVHANACSKLKNAKVVALADKDFGKAKMMAKNLNAEPYNDFDKLLSNEDIDVVAICTPTFLHREMVEKSAKARKHIFCEKPVALTIDETKQMIKAIKKYNVKSMVGHVLRFWPEYVMAKDIIMDGTIGKPIHIFCERLGVIPDWAENGWNKREDLGGGAALDLQIHDLDYMIFLLGEPLFVSSQGIYNENLGGWAHMSSLIKFKSGQNGCVNAGWSVQGKFPFTMLLRIICENGTIEWISRAGENIAETLDGKAQKSVIKIYKSNGEIITAKSKEIDPFYAQWDYFINCVEKNKEIDNSTFEDGKKSLELALATIKSTKENRIIKFIEN
ncbi:MAG: Gfo/Idh/MocA family oxidoreductase [Actinobacteria bacterium]|nr:Gfo/Idh/MocA family oxidoreductase [Actinomycetota bacterium]